MDPLLIHRIGLVLCMKGKPLHQISSKTSLGLGVRQRFTIKTKQLCLGKRNGSPLCFTLSVRSLLMKLNRIQSLPSRDSVFSTIDKYLKQDIHVAHSLSSTTKERWVRSTGNSKEGEISCAAGEGQVLGARQAWRNRSQNKQKFTWWARMGQRRVQQADTAMKTYQYAHVITQCMATACLLKTDVYEIQYYHFLLL